MRCGKMLATQASANEVLVSKMKTWRRKDASQQSSANKVLVGNVPHPQARIFIKSP